MNSRNRQRRHAGFSMVSVLIIGLIAVLMISSLYAMLMPSYQRATQVRIKTALRASTEAALDWATNQLTTAYAQGAHSSIDPLYLGQALTTTVPSSALGNYGYPVNASVSILNITAPSYSYLYSTTLDLSPNKWRVLTGTANIAGKTDTIRVILQPVLAQQDQLGMGNWTAGPLTAQQYVSASGNASFWSYDSTVEPGIPDAVRQYASFNQYLASNPPTMAGFTGHGMPNTLWKGMTSQANVTILGTPPSSGTLQTSSFTSNTIVGGNLFYGPNVSMTMSGNVVGIQNQLWNTPSSMAPPPSHPANAIPLSPISFSGSQSVTLTAGDYFINTSGKAIDLSGKSSIVVDASQGPVHLYIEGTNPTIKIAGQGITNSSGVPSNFVLYYGGSGSISYSGQADFTGVIYAPSAPMDLSGNGNVFGAIVVASMKESGNGGVMYDQQLGKSPIMPQYFKMRVFGGYQTVSWQEL